MSPFRRGLRLAFKDYEASLSNVLLLCDVWCWSLDIETLILMQRFFVIPTKKTALDIHITLQKSLDSSFSSAINIRTAVVTSSVFVHVADELMLKY